MKHSHTGHCQNCGDKVLVADFRTGLIHEHGKYACYEKQDGKIVRLETVAE